MKLKLLLTFDHELPLGGVCTSYQRALFDPTGRLLHLAAKLDVPVVLFTDILGALRFREWDVRSFYEPYEEQLRQCISAQHDVQLHLHPHWLTSSFEKGSFVPSADYRLADFADHKAYSIDHIVQTSVDLLSSICRRADPHYTCTAFRAGGFNMEKATKQIIASLLAHGIRFDSSIAKGFYFRSALSEVNYFHMPSPPNWKIGSDGDIRKEADRGIMEVPIASIPKTPFEMPTRFKLKKLAHRAPENHGPMIHEKRSAGLLSRLKMQASARMLTFDNYTLSADYLMKILDHNVKKYRQYDTIILSAIAHPKTMGSYSFSLMEAFVNRVRQKYPEATFTTFRALAKEIKTG